MNKYFISVLFILSSCVGQIYTPEITLMKGAYKLELLNVHEVSRPDKKWTKHHTNLSPAVFGVNLGNISSNLILNFKLSKTSKATSALHNANSFKVFVKNKEGRAFDLLDNDCDKPLEHDAYCIIRVLAKWENGEAVELNQKDYIDIELKENILSSYEEAVNFNISLDVHRKQKSTVTFENKPSTVNFGNAIDFFTTETNYDLTQFSIDGELDYEIIKIIDNNHDNAFEYTCHKYGEDNRSNKCDIGFKELKAGGYDFNSNPAIFKLAVKFENEEEAKEINKKELNLKGKRNKAPQIVFLEPGDLVNTINTFTIKNNSELDGNNSKIDNISLESDPSNPTVCNTTNFNFENIDCDTSIILDKAPTNSTCQVKVNVDFVNLAENKCKGHLVYKGDNNKTIKKHQVIINGVPSKLVFYNETTCHGEAITSLNFLDTVINTASTRTISVKNIGINDTGINIFDATDISNLFNPATFYSIESNTCNNTIGGGLCCNYVLKFSPTTNTPQSSTFKINHRDSSMYPTAHDKFSNLTLSGTGKDPAQILLNTAYDFGEIVNVESLDTCQVETCDPSTYYNQKTKTITIINTGEWAASNLSINIIGSNYFTQTNNCPSDLEVGASCNITSIFNYSTYSADDGTPATGSLNIAYNDGKEIINKTATLNGTILVPGVLSVKWVQEQVQRKMQGVTQTYNQIINYDSEIYSNLHGGILYNHNLPYYLNKIEIKNNKNYSTKISNININLNHFQDIDDEDDDFTLFSDNCTDGILNSNDFCDIEIKFKPINENVSNYGGNLAYHEKINLQNLEEVSQTKIYRIMINYKNHQESNNFNFRIKSQSLKPAELLLQSLSYNTATYNDPTNPNYGQIDRTATSYTRVTRYVNLCKKEDGSSQVYRLFPTQPTSICTYTQQDELNNSIPGMPLQTYWDFDKEHFDNNNTANDFTISLQNFGATKLSTGSPYSGQGGTHFYSTFYYEIDPLTTKNAIVLSLKPLNKGISGEGDSFNIFNTYTNTIQHTGVDISFNYSDYTGGQSLTLHGYVLNNVTATQRFKADEQNVTKLNLYHNAGFYNNTINDLKYEITFNSVQVPGPYYNVNMPIPARKGFHNIFNIKTYNGLVDFFNTNVLNLLKPIGSIVNIANFDISTEELVKTINIGDIQFDPEKDNTNLLCNTNLNKNIGFNFSYSDYNKFSPANINASTSTDLGIAALPTVHFDNTNPCTLDFGSNVTNKTVSLNLINKAPISVFLDFNNRNTYNNPSLTVNDFDINPLYCKNTSSTEIASNAICTLDFTFNRDTGSQDENHAEYNWYYYNLPFNIDSYSRNFNIMAKASTYGTVTPSSVTHDLPSTNYRSTSSMYNANYYCYNCENNTNTFEVQFSPLPSNYLWTELYFISIFSSTEWNALHQYSFNYKVNGLGNFISYSSLDLAKAFPYNPMTLSIQANNFASLINTVNYTPEHSFVNFYSTVSNKNKIIQARFNIRHGFSLNTYYKDGVKKTSNLYSSNTSSLNHSTLPLASSFHWAFIVSKNQLIEMCQDLNNKIFIDNTSVIYNNTNYIHIDFKADCCSAELNITSSLNTSFCN